MFSIVFIYNVLRERQFLLIYYTVWTFILETVYFGLRSANRTIAHKWANKIWPFLFAPAVVVCLGFWIAVAPVLFQTRNSDNLVSLFITHGMNMIAVCMEERPVFSKDVWKPILYTLVYNLFLAIYVGLGGRSISGNLPYWYAQYDKPIGWIFGAMATAAVAIVHLLVVSPEPKESPKQYIV